ncbi:MAG: FliM/FliN family flagellar motor switch protein, partial [Rhodospirillales bacterium]|nr:FliM/FliN family flagellar motor switch protein [Rhodospirillales bacterium]
RTMRLRDVFNLQVGSQIMFNATPESMVEMRCGDVIMYNGRMGRKGDRIAIQIEDRIAKTKGT